MGMPGLKGGSAKQERLQTESSFHSTSATVRMRRVGGETCQKERPKPGKMGTADRWVFVRNLAEFSRGRRRCSNLVVSCSSRTAALSTLESQGEVAPCF